MKIQVTKEDIRDGLRSDCRMCPLALSLTRVFNDNAYYSVNSNNIIIGSTKTIPYFSTTIPLPEICGIFSKNFDEGIEVKPFEYELNLSEIPKELFI